MASPSDAVSDCPSPAPPCTPAAAWRCSEKIITTLSPIFEICATMLALAPLPIASTTITAAMPKIIPSIVRAERVLFRQMARAATLTIMAMFIQRRVASRNFSAIALARIS